MVSSSKSSTLLSLTLVFVISFARILATSNPSSDHNNLVYKHCANETIFLGPSLPPSTVLLSSLLQELVEKSSESKFYETNIGDDTTAISGLFQCRGDLSNDECYNCVNKIPKISNTLCGETVPARVQLSGCYIHYELDGAKTIRDDLLHKACGESIGGLISGFQEVLSGAFGALLSCVMRSSSHGYCDLSYEGMHVMAQCEGNLGDCECGECVTNAMQIAQDECSWDSVSGDIYLESCHVRYIYQAHGLPGNSLPKKGKGGVGSAKLVAIVVGEGLLCVPYLSVASSLALPGESAMIGEGQIATELSIYIYKAFFPWVGSLPLYTVWLFNLISVAIYIVRKTPIDPR